MARSTSRNGLEWDGPYRVVRLGVGWDGPGCGPCNGMGWAWRALCQYRMKIRAPALSRAQNVITAITQCIEQVPMNIAHVMTMTNEELLRTEGAADDFDYQLTYMSTIIGPHVLEIERDQDDGYRVAYMRATDVCVSVASMCSDSLLKRSEHVWVAFYSDTMTLRDAVALHSKLIAQAH